MSKLQICLCILVPWKEQCIGRQRHQSSQGKAHVPRRPFEKFSTAADKQCISGKEGTLALSLFDVKRAMANRVAWAVDHAHFSVGPDGNDVAVADAAVAAGASLDILSVQIENQDNFLETNAPMAIPWFCIQFSSI